MILTKAYTAQNATTDPAPWSFEYRDPEPREILIDIHFCGFVIRIFIRLATNWGMRFTRWFLVTRSSELSQKWGFVLDCKAL
jgi:hypothetical protein